MKYYKIAHKKKCKTGARNLINLDSVAFSVMTQVVPNYVSALYALSQMYSLNYFY